MITEAGTHFILKALNVITTIKLVLPTGVFSVPYPAVPRSAYFYSIVKIIAPTDIRVTLKARDPLAIFKGSYGILNTASTSLWSSATAVPSLQTTSYLYWARQRCTQNRGDLAQAPLLARTIQIPTCSPTHTTRYRGVGSVALLCCGECKMLRKRIKD